MAADETDPLYEPSRRKRSRSGRPPPVIEGEVATPAPASAPAPEPEPESEPAPAPEPAPVIEPQAAEPAPPPSPVAAQLLPLAVAVVMGAMGLGAGLYGAYQAQSSSGEIMDLRTEVAGLRARGPASAPAPAASPDQLAALERRIVALEQRPVAPVAQVAPAPAAPAADPAEMRALATRISGAEAAVKAAGDSASAALATANRAAEASARPLPPPVDLQPLDKRLATLEGREAPLAAMAQRSQAAGLAVVGQSIALALDQGVPFESALAAAASLGAEAGKLAPLQAVAKTGAPSARSLVRLWAGASSAALESVQQPEGDQGWLDRLKAGASRVVRVRPVGESSSEDPAALAARIDAALGRGAVGEALAAWTKLPEPARAASRAFGEAAGQQVAAHAAARALVTGALADLARSKGAP